MKAKDKLFSRITLTFYKPIEINSYDLKKENDRLMDIIKTNLEG